MFYKNALSGLGRKIRSNGRKKVKKIILAAALGLACVGAQATQTIYAGLASTMNVCYGDVERPDGTNAPIVGLCEGQGQATYDGHWHNYSGQILVGDHILMAVYGGGGASQVDQKDTNWSDVEVPYYPHHYTGLSMGGGISYTFPGGYLLSGSGWYVYEWVVTSITWGTSSSNSSITYTTLTPGGEDSFLQFAFRDKDK